jgi:hypothetical protein
MAAGVNNAKRCYLQIKVASVAPVTKVAEYRKTREVWQRGLKASPDAKNLRARLDTKNNQEQLKYVESQLSLDKPVDTALGFLDWEK